jgi:hypothetical protein
MSLNSKGPTGADGDPEKAYEQLKHVSIGDILYVP